MLYNGRVLDHGRTQSFRMSYISCPRKESEIPSPQFSTMPAVDKSVPSNSAIQHSACQVGLLTVGQTSLQSGGYSARNGRECWVDRCGVQSAVQDRLSARKKKSRTVRNDFDYQWTRIGYFVTGNNFTLHLEQKPGERLLTAELGGFVDYTCQLVDPPGYQPNYLYPFRPGGLADDSMANLKLVRLSDLHQDGFHTHENRQQARTFAARNDYRTTLRTLVPACRPRIRDTRESQLRIADDAVGES